MIPPLSYTDDFGPAKIGPKGEQGLQGSPGENGDPGIPGILGRDGIPGIKGNRGDPGLFGVKGKHIIYAKYKIISRKQYASRFPCIYTHLCT